LTKTQTPNYFLQISPDSNTIRPILNLYLYDRLSLTQILSEGEMKLPEPSPEGRTLHQLQTALVERLQLQQLPFSRSESGLEWK
jgi:hypothetical protein